MEKGTGVLLLVLGMVIVGAAAAAGPVTAGHGRERIHPRMGVAPPTRGEHITPRGANQARGDEDAADEDAGEEEGGKKSKKMPWKVAMSSRQWRNALPGLRAAIAANPDDPTLQAYLGVVNSRIGRFAEAATAFDFALGSDVYEDDGVERNADALRYTGHPEEAYELRRSAWLMERSVNRALSMVVGMIDDLRYAGDYETAYDWAWYFIGEAPHMEEAYAVAADVALDVGDLEEADLMLWYADLYGSRVARTRAARARAELKRGDLKAAFEEVRYGRMRNRNHLPWAIQGEALRMLGRPEEALALLEAGHLPDKDRPEMVATRIAALASAGELQEAEDLRRSALWTYPTDPDVIAAGKVVDLAIERARGAK